MSEQAPPPESRTEKQILGSKAVDKVVQFMCPNIHDVVHRGPESPVSMNTAIKRDVVGNLCVGAAALCVGATLGPLQGAGTEFVLRSALSGFEQAKLHMPKP